MPDANKLEPGQDEKALESGDDLAVAALSEANKAETLSAEVGGAASDSATDDEVAESNKLAETLQSLQNLVERHANQLLEITDEMKQKRESLRDVFDNDSKLGEAKAVVEVQSDKVKERKSELQSDPQITSLKVQLSELREQKKELEETLSNHLINYHSLTNSKSIDTSDGDQWEFTIKARIKARRK